MTEDAEQGAQGRGIVAVVIDDHQVQPPSGGTVGFRRTLNFVDGRHFLPFWRENNSQNKKPT
jgi:hypothetical protein